MKIILLLVSIIFLLNTVNYSQCKSNEQKLLVLGDSWAFFSWTYNSYNENMDRFGLSDYKTYSTPILSVNGTKASNFFTPARTQALTDALNNNPSIEHVHFSLGGNDILGTYHTSNTTAQNQQDYYTLMVDVKAGIDIVHSINPNVKVFLAGYDYPNFEESIQEFIIPSQHPFYDKWDGMGQPTATQLNAVITDVIDLFIDSANVWNNVEFVNNLGLMQNTYGQSTPLAVAPGGTYAAGSLNVPGGLTDYPSPLASLNLGGNDSFHLSNNGFEHFIKRHFKEYYWDELRDYDAEIVATDKNMNGTVNANSVTTDSITVGANASILTFNTSSLNSQSNIADASIFLKRNDLIGDNLKEDELFLEIKTNNFGASLQLELDDYNSQSDASSTACTYGSVEDNESWLRVDIPYNMLPYINKSGTTQFRLKYNNVTANNNFIFNNSNDPEKQPILDIKYGGFSNVEETLTTLNVQTYPNPFTNEVIVESIRTINNIFITDINGRIITTLENLQKKYVSVNTSDLKKGSYIINILNIDGTKVSKTLVK